MKWHQHVQFIRSSSYIMSYSLFLFLLSTTVRGPSHIMSHRYTRIQCRGLYHLNVAYIRFKKFT